jgi:Cyclic phosphodiesterase-like protein
VTDSESIVHQEWLESLSVSLSATPIVRFLSLDVGERITRKLTLRVAKESTLVDLAIQLRAKAVGGGSREAAENWVKTTWAPHVSLLYADTDIGEEKRLEVMKTVIENGIRIEVDGEGPMEPACAQWEGGKLVWVDTRGEIGGWRILGKRDLEIDAS